MMRLSAKILIILSIITCSTTYSYAGEVTIENAVAKHLGDGKYRFSVTVSHDDTGWDHYADEWQVLDADGNILGTRVLAHPHVNEQPFTRSSSPIVIPNSIKKIYIRAKDNIHGWASKTFELKLP